MPEFGTNSPQTQPSTGGQPTLVGLTERQQREREYYLAYCPTHDQLPVNFAPFDGSEFRPWNSYWSTFRSLADLYRSPDQRLLEFGCGTGQTAVCFAKLGFHVSGFDIAENQIEACRRRAAQMGLTDRTEFTVQKAEGLEYPDESFDFVLGQDILHHIDIPASIRECHRVLKPGGMAFFREWVEVPVFDSLRNTALVRKFFPKDMSLDDHRTHDERKLNQEDIRVIRSFFPHCEERRFGLFSRLRFLFPTNPDRPCPYERFDYWIMNRIPILKKLGGEIVLILHK
jgi:SAM-dependent methyltransferase